MRFSEETLFNYSLLSLFIFALPTFISLQYGLQAPYGRHSRKGCGPTIPPSLAWFFMESPTVWLTLLVFSSGKHSSNPKAIALISIYLFHYFHRTIIYPLHLRFRHTTDPKKLKHKAGFPVYVALVAFAFNILNAYLQTRQVSHYAEYVAESDRVFYGRFCVGLVIFASGMVVNVWSDLVLVRLKGEDGGYKIPTGGWFEWVSCPNYFGEMMEWFGWTVMNWSWASFAFFFYTCANLVPRARANHVWYRDKFEGYPTSRKALVPFIY